MSLEEELRDYLRGTDIVDILVGGIYTDEEVGVEGIRRGGGESNPTKDAFDEDGVLLPCAVVKELSPLPVVGIRDSKEKTIGQSRMFQIYYYQHRNKDQIMLAKDAMIDLLEDHRLSTGYPLSLASETNPMYDVGPVKNSTVMRQDWQLVNVRKPAP